MTRIRFHDGKELSAGAIYGARRQIRNEDRDAIFIELIETDYATVAALFIDGAQFTAIYEEITKVYDGVGVFTGEYSTTETVQENYDFIVAGDITDHRDGSVTVIMGKPTQTELYKRKLAELGITL